MSISIRTHNVKILHYFISAPLATSVPGWATNNDTAATSCSACEAGRYSTEGNNAGADACLACPAGRFPYHGSYDNILALPNTHPKDTRNFLTGYVLWLHL